MIPATTRRGFASGAATAFAGFAIVRAPAKAAQYECKCATTLAPDHPGSVRLVQMWKAVERESGGRIRTQFFPASMLGGDAAMFSQLRLGALTFFQIAVANFATVVPSADIGNIGFAFKDATEVLRIMDGPLGTYIRDEATTKGLHALRRTWDAGMFQVGSGFRPIRNLADLHGFRIRVAGKLLVDLFKTLGASPVPLNANEVYPGLQTKLVDGESAPLASIQAQRWSEVNKFIGLTNHSWSGLWLVVNGDFWKSLPPDLQEIVDRNNTKYALLERRDTDQLNASLADKFSRQGIGISRIDQTPFRALLHPYYESWAREFGATEWGLLESSLGRKLS